MNQKYELTGEAIEHRGRTLYRIRALKDMTTLGFNVRAGTLGGFVESEANLSYDESDNCWIYDDAKVYDNAIVQDWAQVTDVAEIYDRAVVKDCAMVGGDAQIGGNTVVKNYNIICNNNKKIPTSFFTVLFHPKDM